MSLLHWAKMLMGFSCSTESQMHSADRKTLRRYLFVTDVVVSSCYCMMKYSKCHQCGGFFYLIFFFLVQGDMSESQILSQQEKMFQYLLENQKEMTESTKHDGPFKETICHLNLICFKVRHV